MSAGQRVDVVGVARAVARQWPVPRAGPWVHHSETSDGTRLTGRCVAKGLARATMTGLRLSDPSAFIDSSVTVQVSASVRTWSGGSALAWTHGPQGGASRFTSHDHNEY